ncbi:MAG: hypothetical protein MK132_09255 [Lentisphaerales bacterium]|nr:hypothetical protein [Lentisphaerales bacterium]
MKYIILATAFILAGCMGKSEKPEKTLEQKISEIVDVKIKNNNPIIYYEKQKTRLSGAYSKTNESIVYARKSIEVEIDGKKYEKMYLAKSGIEVLAPITKSYKSGKKIVTIIITVDGQITRSKFTLAMGPSEMDFLLGQNFIIDNFFKD